MKLHPEMTAVGIAEAIRSEVFRRIQLTCSVGVACNKRLAKVSCHFVASFSFLSLLFFSQYSFVLFPSILPPHFRLSLPQNDHTIQIGADFNKPDGVYHIESRRASILDFVHSLPIRKMNGIGKVFLFFKISSFCAFSLLSKLMPPLPSSFLFLCYFLCSSPSSSSLPTYRDHSLISTLTSQRSLRER